MDEKVLASIDIGTSKFGICVARVTGDDVRIIYYKETPSAGIRASVIQDQTKASAFLKKAIQEVEDELKVNILQVVVGMPRIDVQQGAATSRIERLKPGELITKEDVENLKQKALDSYWLDDETSQYIYDVVPQTFSIDDQSQLVERDIVGRTAKKLEGNFKVFVGSRRAANALDMSLLSLYIAIGKKYFLPDIVAKAVLTEEDRQSGVALVDVGAGVTSVTIYQGGIMQSYAAVPIGGKAISDEIRTLCCIPEELAEDIIIRFGSSQPTHSGIMREDVLQNISKKFYKEVTAQYISKVIDAQCRIIIKSVMKLIRESSSNVNLINGIVLTGGCASLVNFASLVKEMSGYDVRIGISKQPFSSSVGTGVYSPSAVSAIAMILAAKDDRMPDCVTRPEPVWC